VPAVPPVRAGRGADAVDDRRTRLFGCRRLTVAAAAVSAAAATADARRHRRRRQRRLVRCRRGFAAPRDGRGGGSRGKPPTRRWGPVRGQRAGRLRQLRVGRRHGRRLRIAAGPTALPPQRRRPPPPPPRRGGRAQSPRLGRPQPPLEWRRDVARVDGRVVVVGGAPAPRGPWPLVVGDPLGWGQR